MVVRYGRYEVLYKLGQGAMAQVFLAKDPVLSRFVAIKVLHTDVAARKDVLQRFFNEARTVAVVRNPHVVEVFDFGQEGKDLYLVMEFVDGLSLHGLLRQLGDPHHEASAGALVTEHPRSQEPIYAPLDSTVAAALMCQAAEGLTLAAQHGVVHRDIKPENLMINSQGYLKISDFGIAHVQDDSLTKTGAVLGSPLYMSPEQARGQKPITSQADMFSLGAVFYACLVGHPPFKGRSITDLFRKIASEPHAPLWRLRPDLDPALGNLVDTLLQKHPGDRGGGPRWLHRQLKGYLMALGVMDPAELIGGYVKELSARGIQTTWKLDGRGGTLPMGPRSTVRSRAASIYTAGTLPAESLPVGTVGERPQRESVRRRPALSLYASMAALALGVGAGVWEWSRRDPDLSRDHLPAPSREALRGTGSKSAIAGGVAEGGLHSRVAAAPEGPASVSEPGNTAENAPEAAEETAIPSAGNPSSTQITSGQAVAVLLLKSSPPFSEAYVDGRFVGVTPVRIDPLEPGRHRVILRAKGVALLDTILALPPGSHALKFHLESGAPTRVAVYPED